MIIESIKEEWLKLKKDRIMLLTLIILPILINIIIASTLSKGVMSQIPMGIVDEDNSSLSRSAIQYFNQNDTFKVTYFPSNKTELESLLQNSKIKVGMVIPKNFAEEVTALHTPNILMLYDASHMGITSVAKAKASEILLSMRVGGAMKQIEGRLGKNKTQAYIGAMPIAFENRMLYNPTKNFSYYMTPGYGTIICQTAIGLTAVLSMGIAATQFKRRKLIGYILGKISFYGGIGSCLMVFNLITQITLFHIPFKGNFFLAILLSILLSLSVAALSVAVSAWLSNPTVSLVVIGLLLIPNSIMAGYTWPVLSMVPIYQWVAPLIPFYHYGDNIRNLFLKGNLVNVMGDICFFIFFSLGMVAIAIVGSYFLTYYKSYIRKRKVT